ncbi:SUMO-targeted ubiquitin ligase complex subunit slx8 [Coccidioides posadasii str. Silveira]|uniref:RING-type domain-containing protein n=3 Tax=Coccidioides posadasii TaxID=199306 RepID=E9D2Q8_COCPS|nr:C3HC4 type (RING finger) zinc finger containing protein [Coccidioides posadasii C735 delta SOWgp]EER25096.1 C3HC4 type (RING finger) zinc finger containing protein [Coccidioides posadasii C735 delta SOWgp]EFW19472.1 conserved hypothetical protein [Coccidioides posadasii str. Silveira]KMM71933.1 hypothetical protein CPAG_08233 [Coccidioides posadasii RMSCC 3488]QVM13082.1 SUMO-targeted ubiquitin ligase complex subunit slx8 [Coccidioides posadasii str. Silveira]|eukprot:XP_003067241.1 C3HC4 type (RING finger) zinc finger containing protein [Coccidioides posadasii C735 delta SOWgp]
MSRSASAFVDLTTLGSSSPYNGRDEIRPLSSLYTPPPNPSRLHVSGDSHDSKRRRLNHGAAAGPSILTSHAGSTPQNSSAVEGPDVESIDLTSVNDSTTLAHALSKQREDAVKAQHSAKDETGRSALTSYKCPVCMDTPEDATITICGHLFCHKCIIDTLRFGEERRIHENGKTPRGNCPVCRRVLTRSDVPGPRRNLVPLQLKLTTKKKQ